VSNDKFKGLHAHRLAKNPEERAFAKAWARENDSDLNRETLSWLLGRGDRKVEVSERDHVVAATVIQWLGSEVGRHFLEELGYEKKATRPRRFS
jgi:hypothetical protein